MALDKVNKKIVTLEPDGKLAVIVSVNGKPYTTLTSDLVAKCKADIKYFTSIVFGETMVTSFPKDLEPLEKENNDPC